MKVKNLQTCHSSALLPSAKEHHPMGTWKGGGLDRRESQGNGQNRAVSSATLSAESKSMQILIFRAGLGLVAGRVGNGHRRADHDGGDRDDFFEHLDPDSGPHHTFRIASNGNRNRGRISADHSIHRGNQGNSGGFAVAGPWRSPINAPKIAWRDGFGSCDE